ncbi:hypothetical protein CUMW_205530 [Citrus unshiu]|uniref:Secreted protein n=1 Tax=Citrus unshiu TaxID=55188 RepID=A0A2H5Q8B6_CITUN|nr:hypothetical protein CUMW_205530 [Citrus unshiu]GAY60879.1 hypothetical protein CUMW_205530 [Citrus unshiu]
MLSWGRFWIASLEFAWAFSSLLIELAELGLSNCNIGVVSLTFSFKLLAAQHSHNPTPTHICLYPFCLLLAVVLSITHSPAIQSGCMRR